MPPTSAVLLSPENTRVKWGDYRGDKLHFAISLFACPRVMAGSRRESLKYQTARAFMWWEGLKGEEAILSVWDNMRLRFHPWWGTIGAAEKIQSSLMEVSNQSGAEVKVSGVKQGKEEKGRHWGFVRIRSIWGLPPRSTHGPREIGVFLEITLACILFNSRGPPNWVLLSPVFFNQVL